MEKPTFSQRQTDYQSGVDGRSIINPNAFRYIEKQTTVGKVNDDLSMVDYRPIVDPEAFKWIERKQPTRRIDDGPDIDERSYVNPQAFRYIDRQLTRKTEPPSTPKIDTRSYILKENPRAFDHLERRGKNSENVVEGGVDERSYVNPSAFRFVEGFDRDNKAPSVHSSAGPPIDTRSYVNSEAFRHLEVRQGQRTQNDDDDDRFIDERSYVSPGAFRHLEFNNQAKSFEQNSFSSYGISDV